jgi:hypothetical protein
MPKAVYNSSILSMLTSPSRWLRFAGFLLILSSLSAGSFAANWTMPEEQLARKIAGATGPGAVALEITNASSLPRSDFDEIRRGLTTQLAYLGLRFVNSEQAAATVHISLSEDLQNYVWVAEVRQGNNEYSVAMVSVPRPATLVATRDNASLTVHKTLLWSQDDRILDATVLDGNPAHLAVLSADKLDLYGFRDGRWQPEQSFPITHSHPWPRDLRGRLILRQDHLFDAHLPGVFCKSTTTAPLGLNCHESDDPWPVGSDQFALGAFFAPARNFFTGVLVPGVGKQAMAPAFYSAATLPRDKYTLALFAGVDGQIHMLDGITDRTPGKLGWGSDIASIHTECGSGWQVLATGNGSGPSDAVRAYEIPDREPVLVSQPLEFAGAITALWAESNGNTAIAVLLNSETGKYEAYRLTIVCGQ